MDASVDEAIRALLTQADDAIDSVTAQRQSLAPDRERATSCVELGARCLDVLGQDPQSETVAFAQGLHDIAAAIVECFPENIFWDLDYLAAVLCAQPTPSAIARMAARVVELQRNFGRGTQIRFRYAHDFLFGFDWARWVRKEPSTRSEVGPFDPTFLSYLEQRHGELIELITADDEKYPALEGDEPRNPFRFAREPEAEAALHHALAADGLIPVSAWDWEGRREWDRDYTAVREAYAQRLGVPVRR